MKKLFALVLVLAMALAIAVPALAATGWDKPETPPTTYNDFSMSAEKYEFYGSTAAGYAANGTYYANWDDSKGIVRDTLGRVYFSATLPKLTDAQGLYPGVDFTQPVTITVKITNVKGVGACTLGVGTVTDPAALATTGITKNVFEFSETKTLGAAAIPVEYMYVFAAASAADVVGTITIEAGDTTLEATFVYGGKTLTANTTTDNGCEFIFSTSATEAILFDVAADGKIQRLFINTDVDGAGAVFTQAYYQVLVDVNGQISFKDGAQSIQLGDTGYNTLKGLYDFYMGALGFAWDGSVKYMTSALILKNLIAGAAGSASVKFPAGYQSIVDPTVQPPQTGDATTVVGFVMIALALVAAAAVTVKKVRA